MYRIGNYRNGFVSVITSLLRSQYIFFSSRYIYRILSLSPSWAWPGPSPVWPPECKYTYQSSESAGLSRRHRIRLRSGSSARAVPLGQLARLATARAARRTPNLGECIGPELESPAVLGT